MDSGASTEVTAIVQKTHSHMFGRKSLQSVQPARVGFDYSKLNDVELVKLDANEIEAFDESLKLVASKVLLECDLSRYPDPNANKVRDVISEYLDVPADSIVVGNGSDELLANIFLSFFGMKMMVPDISYPVYYHLANLNEVQLKKIQLTESYDLPDNLQQQVRDYGPDIIVFSYPNNPTGTLFNRGIIENLINDFPETVFVLDEAYYEFCDETFIQHAFSKPNLIILRTFSKIFALAGLRVGYAIAGNGLLDLLQKTKLIYSVSSVSQDLACALQPILKNKTQRIRDLVAYERTFYAKALSDTLGTKAAESHANFVFIPIPSHIDCREIERNLRNKNIFLRFMSYEGSGMFLRFSLGDPKNNRKAFDAFEEQVILQKERINVAA